MTPDLQDFGTVVGLSNSSVVRTGSAPVMSHIAGKRHCYNTHCIPLDFLEYCKIDTLLESRSVDSHKGPGTGFGIGMETKLLGNRTAPGCSFQCWASRSQFGTPQLRPQPGSSEQQFGLQLLREKKDTGINATKKFTKFKC